jgi:hypothetical protein
MPGLRLLCRSILQRGRDPLPCWKVHGLTEVGAWRRCPGLGGRKTGSPALQPHAESNGEKERSRGEGSELSVTTL